MTTEWDNRTIFSKEPPDNATTMRTWSTLYKTQLCMSIDAQGTNVPIIGAKLAVFNKILQKVEMG